MKKRSFILSLAVLLVVSTVLTGCGTGKDAAAAAENTAEKKDSINIAISSEPTTLDPMNGNDLLTFAIQYQIFDTLVREDQDGKLVPGLAEKWDISPDGTEITFYLRKGVKFQNGEEMTADDVVFSFQRAIASSYTTRITGSMDSVEAVDGSTVKLKLKYPYGPILGCIASANMGIVSKKAVEQNAEGFARNPIGTGPYQLVEWKTGDKLVFKSFKAYYRGEAAIKNLTYSIITDSSTALVALEKGEVDQMMSPAAADRKNIENDENLKLYETPEASYLFVAFNTEKGLFTNKLLRQAVSYAIDRNAVILGALEGTGTPLEVPIPPSCFGYPKDFKNNPYDPEKAKELLKEAGYPNGLKVKLRTMEGPTYAKPAEIIQENLRVVGIDAELEVMERGAYLKDVYTDCNYEITVNIVSALVLDADLITYGRFYSGLVGGGNNFTRFRNDEMDKALDLGRKSLSEQERMDAYLKVCQIVKDEAPLVPVMSGLRVIAANKNLAGVQAHPTMKYYVYDYHWE